MKYRVFGVYITEDIVNDLSYHFYNEAGVVNIRDYFDVNKGSIPEGDPGAKEMNKLAVKIDDNFADIYDDADFESAGEYEPNEYELIKLAGEGSVVYNLRDKFKSASIIRECDSRVIHTAILRNSIDSFDLEISSRKC